MIFKTDFKKSLYEDTMRKILKKTHYHGRVARRKSYISAVNKQKRLIFANECGDKSPQFWEKVIFSDDSKFYTFGIKGCKLVWRKQGRLFRGKILCLQLNMVEVA